MSSQSIQLLDASVIHQLRSSLVISTLPQCLKELINNAVDSNATNIEILIDIEKFSLQVKDNGNGIQNLSKIGQRHVTSKCHTLFDVSQLKTFGFRGEALASITNEAMVQIISRHYLSQDTFEGFWRDGRIIGDKISNSKYKRKAHSGTTFPVRRTHLTSSPYQHVVIIESVKRLIIHFALCFQNINFTLVDSTRNTKLLMTTTCQGTFQQLFGLDMIKYTKYVDMHEDNVKVEGFFSTRGYPNKEQDSTITTKARPSTHKHPIFVIKFTCPDWSYYDIHTYLETLTEYSAYNLIKSLLIKFTNKFLLLSGLSAEKGEKRDTSKKRSRLTSESTRKTRDNPYMKHLPSVSSLIQSTRSNINVSSSPKSDFTAESSSAGQSDPISWWDTNQKRMFYIDQRTGNSYLSPPITEIQNSHTQNSIDRSHLKRTKPNYPKEPKNTRIIHQQVLDLPHKLSKSDLQNSLVLAQIDKKYILIKSNQGFVMIDQHAADERVKLEEMSTFEPTTLVQSICIKLDSSYEYQIVTSDRVLRFLKIWGIHVVTTADPISNDTAILRSRFFSTPDLSPHFNQRNHLNRIYVTQLPLVILDRCVANHALLKDIVRDYAYWIKDQNQESLLSIKECPKGIMEILKSKACRNAIMFNDILTKNQCKEIVERLARCSFPFQCAHGRPSVVPINPDLNSLRTPERKITWDNFMKNTRSF
ncbi:hypothetical protein INT48_007162 [Thamnidium elegans]|uniref:MutL C-terminal dimerisation domain-containing protein n=1 Tax=Thamnidium elegans TaxID=101142 RepID=A0A8H7SP34_9FUNG|nr:hypothetical protein INT48_007162 [Thamnidium elegans]